MKVAERGMSNLDEEFWVMYETDSKDEVKHVGRSGEWLWVMMVVWSEWHKVKSVCCDRGVAEKCWGFCGWEKWYYIHFVQKLWASELILKQLWASITHLESILEVSDACLKVWEMKGEKKLCVISIEVVI